VIVDISRYGFQRGLNQQPIYDHKAGAKAELVTIDESIKSNVLSKKYLQYTVPTLL
jgi:hypothetical protein